MEDPPKDSVFRVRKYPVESSKIERFKRDKGIDNDGYDRLMLGAGTLLHPCKTYQIILMTIYTATPSDISCDTPQPENRETLVQSTGITLESSSHDRISPVQQVISRSLYHDALSPRLQASGSFYFGHPSPSQASAAKSLDFSYSQTGCTITQSPSLTWSNLDNQSLSNSPRHSRPSPPFRRTLTSPYLPTAETALTFSSSHSSYAPLRNTTDWSMDPISTIDEPDLSKCDWFESFINYRSRSSSSTLSGSIIADLVRSFIKPVDTYQAQREYEVLRSALSVSKKNMRAEFEQGENGCGTCEALNSLSLFKRFTHTRYSRPEDLNCNVDRSWLVSETLQALLPALNRVDQIALYIARSAAQILTFEGRYQDVERIVQVIIQEMDRLSAWDHMGKEDLSLDLAEIYVFCGRYDRAQKIVQDVLKDDFPKLAMIARTKDVEFYAEADLTFFEKNSLWTWNSETTDEGVAYIKKVMGKGIAKLGVYKQAICVLNFLNRYRVVDITDVSLGRKDLTVSS